MAAPLTFLHVLGRHPEKAPHADFSGQIGLGAQEDLLQALGQLDERRSVLAQEQGRQLQLVVMGAYGHSRIRNLIVDARGHLIQIDA